MSVTFREEEVRELIGQIFHLETKASDAPLLRASLIGEIRTHFLKGELRVFEDETWLGSETIDVAAKEADEVTLSKDVILDEKRVSQEFVDAA